jgi:3-hydroxyisobutyrate dehydrogenase-like beta-hydroxyacid dehydrogenase
VISAAGGRFIDAGIIGSPPGRSAAPRFYVSGPHETVMAELDGRGISVRLMGGEVGRASGIKMCYAALTKGTNALYAATLTAAESLGLYDDLQKELEASQQGMLKGMQGIVGLPGKAFRWVGEMEEIAATFASAGVTPKIHEGAADVFRMVADSALGNERPETVDRGRTVRDTVRAFAEGRKTRT